MILVFGNSGQVSSELAKLEDVTCLGRDKANLADPGTCVAAIRDYKPNTVINAAAFTSVDQAEQDVSMAMLVNAKAPTDMAAACAELDIPFIHISTDYVFDGSGSAPWQETDETAPLSVYGLTKRQGEVGVLAANPTAVILRTSWVFSIYGTNFVKTMLRLGALQDKLSIVADQIGGPTPSVAIAQACHKIARDFDICKSGIYHFAGTPQTTRADFARTIFDIAQMPVRIHDIASSDYPSAAPRPLNSRLDCSRILADFGIKEPEWKIELKKILMYQEAVK